MGSVPLTTPEEYEGDGDPQTLVKNAHD